jgi:hypothetical protein
VSLDITGYADGLSVLERMALARNKIVHNDGMVKARGSTFVPIPIEGDREAPDLPSASIAEYVHGDDVRVSKEVFIRNREWCASFLAWIDAEIRAQFTAMATHTMSTKPS